jgi:hypothetical protein
MWLVFAIVLYSAHCFSISADLTEAGASITPDILAKITNICDIAYSFYRTDLAANAKYISDALPLQGLGRNWDVIIAPNNTYLPGYKGHSTNETWWVYLNAS